MKAAASLSGRPNRTSVEDHAGVGEYIWLLEHMHAGLVAAVKELQSKSALGHSFWIQYTKSKERFLTLRSVPQKSSWTFSLW